MTANTRAMIFAYSRVHGKPKCDTHGHLCLINLSKLITNIIVAKLNSSLAQERCNLVVLSRYDETIQLQEFRDTQRLHSTGATSRLLLLVASCPLYEKEATWLSKHALQFPELNAKFSLCL